MTGFIILDKPQNITSFSATGIVRRIAKEKKAGHTGTLDPMATGVLPIALGHATRFIDLLPCHDKGYLASFRLGETTDTLDSTGTVLTSTDNIPDENTVINSFEQFRGEIEQLPPMYSAIQINGQRLYDLARKGIEVERSKRAITIYSLEYISHKENEYTINVKCSKGTYIRSLISDIGEALGCGAVMTSLRRNLSNGFSLEDAHDEQELKDAENFGQFLIPVHEAFSVYEEIIVTPAQAIRFKNGGELDVDRLHRQIQPSLYRIYSPEHDFLGLGEYTQGEASLKVKRVYVND